MLLPLEVGHGIGDKNSVPGATSARDPKERRKSQKLGSEHTKKNLSVKRSAAISSSDLLAAGSTAWLKLCGPPEALA